MTDATSSANLPAAAAALPDDRLPAQVREIADYCADELGQAGLSQADSRRLGVRIAARLSQALGGASFYWKKGDELARTIRDLKIWSEHDGTTDGPNGIKALARRHGITDVLVWHIIRRERARARAQSGNIN